MTCNECVARVEELLAPHFKRVKVRLYPGTLTLFTKETPTPREINELLRDTPYRVRQANKRMVFFSYVKLFSPLILVTLLVTLFTLAHVWWHGFSIHTVMQYFMAGYFLFFGGLKVYSWRGFVASYRKYDALAGLSLWYAAAYPFLELLLCVLFYLNLWPIAVSLFVFLLFIQKAESVYQALKSGTITTCACLGTAFTVPLTRVTLFEDIFMAVMALMMLFIAL